MLPAVLPFPEPLDLAMSGMAVPEHPRGALAKQPSCATLANRA